MNQLDTIREQIRALFERDPKIHVSINMQRPKLSLKNDLAVIKEIYPRVFVLEEQSSGTPKCHTVQYAEVLTKQIRILELEEKRAL